MSEQEQEQTEQGGGRRDRHRGESAGGGRRDWGGYLRRPQGTRLA
jgi:hypothetical protein